MNERERLLKLIADNNMSAKQFAAEVGIQAGTISNIVNGRNNPSLDVMQRVLNRFRTLSSDWLILGVGNMYRTEGGKENKEKGEAKDKQQEIPGFGDSIASQQRPIEEEPLPSSSRPLTISAPAMSRETQQSATTKKQQIASMEQPAAKQIERIIVFYSDGTFDEISSK
ncbi:MAG: helix-turn-helix domain-containing protein [Paludibacteraceae bacterium]